MAEELLRVTKEWDIENKVACCVSDNAANITKAIKLLKWTHHPCLVHAIHLMVRDALKVMKTTLDKVKGMVDFFHKSTRATEKLKSTQRQMDMPELRLKQDCVTMWNSTLYMLKRVLESKDAIISTLALINAHIDALDQEEWEALQETCTVLEPFEQVTVEISSERESTTPKCPSVIQQGEGTTPKCPSVIQQGEGTTPKCPSVIQQGEGTTPKCPVIQQGEGTTPKCPSVIQQGEHYSKVSCHSTERALLQSVLLSFNRESTTPKCPSVIQQGEGTTPKCPVIQQGEGTTPKCPSVIQQGEGTTPKCPSVIQQGEGTTPKCPSVIQQGEHYSKVSCHSTERALLQSVLLSFNRERALLQSVLSFNRESIVSYLDRALPM
ncbi:hypothetical protein NHX12_006157 [Muraenolepis orangiensis]|uniref:DUF659 domain-containing protein n=1 Tax=Muraenolepis orangiensis TaxID=630683 RepID=A0A9Q0DUI6_9TELE|nr:hypothetical protein NHX12_006157 [Muraenolepis orangiensis]